MIWRINEFRLIRRSLHTRNTYKNQSLIDIDDEVADLGKMATDNQVVFFMADSCLLQNSLQISLHKVLPKADE